MASKHTMYLKMNSRILFYNDDLDCPIMLKLLEKYGITREIFKSMVNQHKQSIRALNAVGEYNRATGQVTVVKIDQDYPEYVYEIDVTNGIMRAYASGHRTYKTFSLATVEQCERKAA